MKRRADKASRVSKVRQGAIDRLFPLKGRSDHLLGKQSGNLVDLEKSDEGFQSC